MPIRGQVKTVVPPASSSAGPAVLVSFCSLFTTLEVYDNVTGVTQVFTSDTRAVFTGDVLPMTALPPSAR